MKGKSGNVARAHVRITWFGHSAFLLESSGGKRVLIDPWLDNPKAPSQAKELPPIDLILVTHGHSDHLGNTVELAKKTNAKVVCIFELYQYLTSNGVERVQDMNKGGTLEFDGVRVTMVHAVHSSDIGSEGSVTPGGEPAGFVIDFGDGRRIYHAGDTALFGDMMLIAQLYKPDVALLPIGGCYTMGPREAAKACELINPRHIIGMHYGTFPVLAGTPAELRKYLPARMKGRVSELEPGMAVEL